jgi:hypothetical protein
MRLGLEGMYVNIIKAICDKPVANIMPNGEKLKPFPSKVRNRIRNSLSIDLEFLAREIR